MVNMPFVQHYLSQNQPFKFYIIDSAAEPALNQAIQDFQVDSFMLTYASGQRIHAGRD